MLPVIEKELIHYREHFKNKVIFCNCDDPTQSNFWDFFKDQYEILKYKKLISTHYQLSTLFETSPPYKLEYNGTNVEKNIIAGDGDFRSSDCIEILKQSDIIVTNPPFSLFRQYVAQLIEYEKKFLIIGNVNSIICKEIFPLFMNNKIWMGCSIKSGDREFRVPDDYPLEAAGHRTDENGHKYIRVKGVRWFTNLSHDIMNETIHLYKHYTPDEYPKYDNYDAIEVNEVSKIPGDYNGVMGVPITFLDKYNPKQFEILGATNKDCHDGVLKTRTYYDYQEMTKEGKPTGSSGKKIYESAVLVGNNGKGNYYTNNKREVQSKFSRIFIKRKKGN